MGDFDHIINIYTTIIIDYLIFYILSFYFFIDLIVRFGLSKAARKDFYECGFKPMNQKAVKIPIQFTLVIIFFLIYDSELLFIFPYVASLNTSSGVDLIYCLFFIIVFLVSFTIDNLKHTLDWQW